MQQEFWLTSPRISADITSRGTETLLAPDYARAHAAWKSAVGNLKELSEETHELMKAGITTSYGSHATWKSPSISLEKHKSGHTQFGSVLTLGVNRNTNSLLPHETWNTKLIDTGAKLTLASTLYKLL